MKDELENHWTRYLEQLRSDLHSRVGIFDEDDELRELLLESLSGREREAGSVLQQWKESQTV